MRTSVGIDSLEVESNPYRTTQLLMSKLIESRCELCGLTHKPKSTRV